MGRFAKLLIALGLVPMVMATGRFAWWCLGQTTEWPWEELLALGAGVGLAGLAYVWLPRPTWWYVLGHEATHALAVWFSGGRVLRFRVSGTGGEVVADRNSPLIALAPYVFPFYPVVAVGLWLVLSWAWGEAVRFEKVFWVVWGLAWGFHAAFTLSVLKTAQPDFASQGYFFSFVVIALGNLGLFVALFCLWMKPVGFAEGAAVLGRMVQESYGAAWGAGVWVVNRFAGGKGS
ncbi:MAG: hypothetical protein SNJ84_09495 [Verrucomicrobiia bacterium]